MRALYLADALARNASVVFLRPLPRSLPFKADMLLSVFFNTLRVLFTGGDIYIGIKPFPGVTIPLLLKKALARKKVVVDIDDMEAGYQNGILARISTMVQQPFVKYFDLVTYHNDLLADYIGDTFGVDKKRLYQLSQGVDLNLFHTGAGDAALRNRFPADKKIVLYTGHLNVASDLEPVLGAMKIVQASVDCTFIVAGGGPDEKRFRQLAKDMGVNVSFTGLISHTQAASYMAIADVCLVYYRPVHVNAFRCSMKLREGLAMGKTVVTNDVGELPQFAPFTVQTSSDIGAFAAGIAGALTISREGRGRSGAEVMRRAFDWKTLGGAFYRRLQTLYDGH